MKFLNLNNHKIAYNQLEFNNSNFGIIFIHGYMSNMEGKKALDLQEFCQENNIDFLRFDLLAHGNSSGELLHCSFDNWLNNCLSILDNLTNKPQIIVGSSLGSWLAMCLVKHRAEKIIGLLALAPAADFSKDVLAELSTTELESLNANGFITKTFRGDDYETSFSKIFIDSSKNHYLMDAPYIASIPVMLMNGNADYITTYENSLSIFKNIQAPFSALKIINNGNHSLSRPEDLLSIRFALSELISHSKTLRG